jgi:hypothetical protein
MATKRLPRPRDPAQLAKLIVDIATGEVENRVEDRRDMSAVEMGRKGGSARAVSLSKARRTETAKKRRRPDGRNNFISLWRLKA